MAIFDLHHLGKRVVRHLYRPELIEQAGGIASPGLSHHRAYGSVPRRFSTLLSFASSAVRRPGCSIRVDHLFEQLLILRVKMASHAWTGLDTTNVPSRIPSGTLRLGAGLPLSAVRPVRTMGHSFLNVKFGPSPTADAIYYDLG